MINILEAQHELDNWIYKALSFYYSQNNRRMAFAIPLFNFLPLSYNEMIHLPFSIEVNPSDSYVSVRRKVLEILYKHKLIKLDNYEEYKQLPPERISRFVVFRFMRKDYMVLCDDDKKFKRYSKLSSVWKMLTMQKYKHVYFGESK